MAAGSSATSSGSNVFGQVRVWDDPKLLKINLKWLESNAKRIGLVAQNKIRSCFLGGWGLGQRHLFYRSGHEQAPSRTYTLMTRPDDPVITSGREKIFHFAFDDAARLYLVMEPKPMFRGPFVIECQNMKIFQNQPHVVQLEEEIPSEGAAIIEYCTQGDLFDFLIQKWSESSDRELLGIFRDVLCGVNEIHGKGWVHRDISLENIFLQKTESGLLAKIGDLESAVNCNTMQDDRPRGTQKYFDPDKLNHEMKWSRADKRDQVRLRQAQDVWSVGCVMYMLLTNQDLPWGEKTGANEAFLRSLAKGEGHLEFVEEITSGKTYKPQSVMGLLWSREGFAPFFPLLKQLLQPDPEKRITIQQALNAFNWIYAESGIDSEPDRISPIIHTVASRVERQPQASEQKSDDKDGVGKKVA